MICQRFPAIVELRNRSSGSSPEDDYGARPSSGRNAPQNVRRMLPGLTVQFQSASTPQNIKAEPHAFFHSDIFLLGFMRGPQSGSRISNGQLKQVCFADRKAWGKCQADRKRMRCLATQVCQDLSAERLCQQAE